MKLTIRIKLLIGFALLLLLSSLIFAFAFNITSQYITSQIDSLQTVQAKKGASEVQNFFATINLDSFGMAQLFAKENLSTEDITSQNISTVVNYIIKNKEYIKKISILSPQGKELIKFDSIGQVSKDKLSYEVY